MLKVNIETIPHSSHRYPTVGDYTDHPDSSRSVRVSDMGNVDYEFLVALHELIEQHLCLKRNITDATITAFDVEWEANRLVDGDFSKVFGVTEPGWDPAAPYHKDHDKTNNHASNLCWVTKQQNMSAAMNAGRFKLSKKVLANRRMKIIEAHHGKTVVFKNGKFPCHLPRSGKVVWVKMSEKKPRRYRIGLPKAA